MAPSIVLGTVYLILQPTGGYKMSEVQTTNGKETAVKAPTALDSAKERFKARKNPPSEKEEIAAWKSYFSADEKVAAAQLALEEAMGARTQACKDLVAVRGSEQRKIAGRGVGRFMARGDSAWVLFPSDDTGPELKL